MCRLRRGLCCVSMCGSMHYDLGSRVFFFLSAAEKEWWMLSSNFIVA